MHNIHNIVKKSKISITIKNATKIEKQKIRYKVRNK